MRVTKLYIFLVAACLTATAAAAQDPTTYVLSAYYRCYQAKETRADEIFNTVVKPIWESQVEAGRIAAVGWARHWFGGEWRRLEYIVGSDIGAMVDARNAYIEALTNEHAEASEEFSAICPSHDDYIWTSSISSLSAEEQAASRPAFGASTYFECQDREAESDEIARAAFAPILNQFVNDGKINSWRWLQHVMGGKYRRALVADGADATGMINFWTAFGEALEEQNPQMSARFSSICPTHTDYIWEVSTD